MKLCIQKTTRFLTKDVEIGFYVQTRLVSIFSILYRLLIQNNSRKLSWFNDAKLHGIRIRSNLLIDGRQSFILLEITGQMPRCHLLRTSTFFPLDQIDFCLQNIIWTSMYNNSKSPESYFGLIRQLSHLFESQEEIQLFGNRRYR